MDMNPKEITIIPFALIDGFTARRAINISFTFSRVLPMFSDLISKLLK